MHVSRGVWWEKKFGVGNDMTAFMFDLFFLSKIPVDDCDE